MSPTGAKSELSTAEIACHATPEEAGLRVENIPFDQIPQQSKLFLDYLLSERGQKFLLARSVGPVRLGLGADGVIPADRSDAVKPIHIGPELLTYLDQSKRASFLKEWRRALQDR